MVDMGSFTRTLGAPRLGCRVSVTTRTTDFVVDGPSRQTVCSCVGTPKHGWGVTEGNRPSPRVETRGVGTRMVF